MSDLDFDFTLIDHASNPAGRIEASLDDVLDSLKDIRKAVGHFESESRKSFDQAGASTVALGSIYAEVFSGTVGFLRDAGLAAARFAVEAGVAFGKAALGAAAFRETSELALGALRGGEGVAQFERIKAIAIDMGTPLDETVKSFQKLAAMQFSASQSEQIFGRMQDLRAVGASAEQTGRALLAITQIKAAGRLQGDELNQLAEAGVSVQLVLEEIAKATGKTVPEVMKLKEAGKITADSAIDAIDKAIGKKSGAKVAGDAGRAFIENTVAGMSERLVNLKGVILDDIAQAFQPAFKRVLPMLGRIFEFFESDSFQDFTASVGASFGKIMDAGLRLEPVIMDMLGGLTGDGATTVIDGIAEAVASVIDGFRVAWPIVKEFITGFEQGFGDAWTALQATGDALGQVFGGGDGEEIAFIAREIGYALGDMVVGWIKLTAALGAIAGVAGAAIAGLGILYDYTIGLPAKFGEIGADIAWSFTQGLINALRGAIASVAQAASEIAYAIPEPIRQILGIHSPSRVAYDMGWNVGEGQAGGMWDTLPMIEGAANDVGAAATPYLASPRAAASVGGGSSRLSNRVNQTFNFGGPGDSQEVGKAARDGVGSGADDLFERFALERGAA